MTSSPAQKNLLSFFLSFWDWERKIIPLYIHNLFIFTRTIQEVKEEFKSGTDLKNFQWGTIGKQQ